MNIELSEDAITTLTLGLIVLFAIWKHRGVKIRLSPGNWELDMEHPKVDETNFIEKSVAEAGVEPARELPPTGF